MHLKTHQLTYSVKGKPLIWEIEASFSPGLYVIFGPNGSGKSTLLKVLSSIWLPTRGEVLWQGKNLLSLPRHEISQVVSLVPQNLFPLFDFTVEEMVAMGRYCHNKGQPHQDKELIERALRVVNGWHLRGRLLSQLSGGERQRIYIARALVAEAPVLLLDEPTSHLDLRHQREVWELLRNLANKGKIVLVAAHHLQAAKSYSDEILILNQGHCLFKGPYSSAITSPLLHDLFGVSLEDEQICFAKWG